MPSWSARPLYKRPRHAPALFQFPYCSRLVALGLEGDERDDSFGGKDAKDDGAYSTVSARRGPQARQRVDDHHVDKLTELGLSDDAAKAIVTHRARPGWPGRHRRRRRVRRPRRARRGRLRGRARARQAGLRRSCRAARAISTPARSSMTRRSPARSGGWARDNAEVEVVLGREGHHRPEAARAAAGQATATAARSTTALRRNHADGSVHVRLRARRDAVGRGQPGRARADAAGLADDRA